MKCDQKQLKRCSDTTHSGLPCRHRALQRLYEALGLATLTESVPALVGCRPLAPSSHLARTKLGHPTRDAPGPQGKTAHFSLLTPLRHLGFTRTPHTPREYTCMHPAHPLSFLFLSSPDARRRRPMRPRLSARAYGTDAEVP